MLDLILCLLVCFQLKHFLADYVLQTKYMLGKFKEEDWIMPLTAHAMVHGAMTFCIVVFFTKSVVIALIVSWLDTWIHFIVDRIKASPKMLGRFKPDNKYFWWSLGADQMLHHLTHYAIIYFVVEFIIVKGLI